MRGELTVSLARGEELMSLFDSTKELPEGGITDVRLFPLPHLVMFPHALQPLQINQPRYCEMLQDAVKDDSLIATALLEPGWEHEYEGGPEIASVVCVGRVVSHVEESTGCHNILLLGLRRAQVRQELDTKRRYREAEVRLLGDYLPTEDAQLRQRLRRDLVNTFRSYLPTTEAVQEQFERLLSSQLPLGVLTDIVAFAVNLELQAKQQLLQELNVDRRVELLLRHFQQLQQPQSESSRLFPPPFSLN